MDEWVWSIGGMVLTGETEVLGEKHYTASVVDGWMSMEHWWNDTDRGNWSTWNKTCPSATLPTTNPTYNCLGLNLGLHGHRPTTNLPSPGGTRQKLWRGHLVTKRPKVWLAVCPSVNMTGKCLLLSLLSDTKEFGNTILDVYTKNSSCMLLSNRPMAMNSEVCAMQHGGHSPAHSERTQRDYVAYMPGCDSPTLRTLNATKWKAPTPIFTTNAVL
jgi:hypothetical protein